MANFITYFPNPAKPKQLPHLCSCNNYNNTPPTQQKRTKKRPSSASSVKSSTSGKKRQANTSKSTSSDSNIPKNGTRCGHKLLKQDLDIIKEQLTLLANQKDEHHKYKEKEIEELKTENERLLEMLRNQPENRKDIATTKKYLDQYEDKLNSLYEEFLNATEVMQRNRDKMCRCIYEKTNEYQDLLDSRNKLSESLKESETKCEMLLKKCEKAEENGKKYLEQNVALGLTVKQLESQLQDFKRKLEATKRQHQALIREHSYLQAQQLRSSGEQENFRSCNCDKGTFGENGNDKVLQENKQISAKLEKIQRNYEERTKELQEVKNENKKYKSEIMKLGNLCENLTRVSKEHNATIVRLNSLNHEKDTAIGYQQREIIEKNKQIELLAKNEDRLQKKVVELQEELVSMKISLNSSKSRGCTVGESDDCSLHITQELQDLISALYEEIDKTLIKDEQIDALKRHICGLQCVLSARENELFVVQNELGTLRSRFQEELRKKECLTGKFCQATKCGPSQIMTFEVRNNSQGR